MSRTRIRFAICLAVLSGLLMAAPSAPAATSCSYSASDQTLTVNGSFPRITRSMESIVVQDYPGPVTCSGAPASGVSVTNTDQVQLSGTSYVELAGGPFAPGATPETDQSSEIEFTLAGRGGIANIDGTPGPDLLAWGPNAGLNLNPGTNGDTDVDVTVTGGLSFIVASGAGGNDTISPQADYSGSPRGPGLFSKGGKGNDMLVGSPSDGGILEGGPGRDTIIGGGFNVISGGGGKDLIRAGPAKDLIGAIDGTKDRVICGGGNDYVNADRIDRLKGCEHVRRPNRYLVRELAR